jgi:hypothetical protein
MSFKIRRTAAGVVVCNSTDKLGFHGATPVVQPVGAAQAAVAGTADSAYNSADTVESTLINAQKTLANALRTALVNLGFMRGANAGAVIGTGRRRISRKTSGVIIGGRSDLGIAFHGVTPCVMAEGDALDASTLQAAVTETAGSTWDVHGQDALNQIKVLLNVIRVVLINKGLIAGSVTPATDASANYRIRSTMAGMRITGSVNAKLGFFGATPTIQRYAAAQDAISAADADGTWGAGEATLANACTVLVNELRTALVNKGLIKGAA